MHEQIRPINSGTENIKQNEKQKKFYEKTRNWLESIYGIKFNNIELIGLKKICDQVLSEIEVNDYSYTEMIPHAEVEDRFLREFFDMTHLDRVDMFRCKEEVHAYFQMKQREKNLI